jgi:hypothetical protein
VGFGERGALIELGIYPITERSYAPAFDTAHLGIEFPLMGPIHGQQFLEVGPTQLSRQRSDNLFIRRRLCKLHHPPQILVCEASAKLAHQLSRQCSDNLLTVGCSFILEDFPQDSVPNPPMERSGPEIDGLATVGRPHIQNSKQSRRRYRICVVWRELGSYSESDLRDAPGLRLSASNRALCGLREIRSDRETAFRGYYTKGQKLYA